MKMYILLLIVFMQTALSQTEIEKTVSGVLKYDKVEEAKPYLLHSAVLEVLKDKDPQLEKTLEQKFSVYFETFKTKKLKELDEEERKTFLGSLDTVRSKKLLSYARLGELLDSYAFKSIEASPAAPFNWTASILMNLNPEKFERFRTRLYSDESKVYSNLFVLADINLYGMEWTQLGVEKSASFRNPLITSWLKWLASNRPSNVFEISACEDACVEEFSHWQGLQQEEGMSVHEKFQNSLWLKLSFNLSKLFYSPSINEWTFEWEGRAVLLDANTKKVVYSQALSKERKTWRGLDQQSLNSALASGMYRSALDALSKVTKKIQVSPRLNRLGRLGIQGHKNMGDVILLMEKLKKEGSVINLELQLDLFTPKEAQVLAFYQGEEKTFSDLLSRVKELKSSQSYKLVNENSGIHPVLKLIAE